MRFPIAYRATEQILTGLDRRVGIQMSPGSVKRTRGTGPSLLGASVRSVDLEGVERQLHPRLDAIGPAPRAELLHVLTLPNFDRVGAIQTYWSDPRTRGFTELLIDCEEDRTLRPVLVGMLREADRDAEAHREAAPHGDPVV